MDGVRSIPVDRLAALALAGITGFGLATVLVKAVDAHTAASANATAAEPADDDGGGEPETIVKLDQGSLAVFDLVSVPIAINVFLTEGDTPVRALYANAAYWLLMGDRSLQEYTERRQRMYDKMSDAWKRMLKGLAERIRKGRRWIFYTSASFFPGGVNGNGKPMQMYLNMAPMAMDGAVASYGGEPTFAQFTCEEPISKSTLTPAGKVQVDGLAMVDTLFDGIGFKTFDRTDAIAETGPSDTNGAGCGDPVPAPTPTPTMAELMPLNSLVAQVLVLGFDAARTQLTIEFANTAMVKLLGDATPANLAGRLGPTLVPTTAARAKKVRLFAERHLVKGKRVERARQTWRCRDGTSVQMMVSARPITVKGGPEGSRTLILVHTSSLLPIRKFKQDFGLLDNWNVKGVPNSTLNAVRRAAVEGLRPTLLFETGGGVLYVNRGAMEWYRSIVGDKPVEQWRMRDMFHSRATLIRLTKACGHQKQSMEMTLPLPNNPGQSFFLKASYVWDVVIGTDAMLLTVISSSYADTLQEEFRRMRIAAVGKS